MKAKEWIKGRSLEIYNQYGGKFRGFRMLDATIMAIIELLDTMENIEFGIKEIDKDKGFIIKS